MSVQKKTVGATLATAAAAMFIAGAAVTVAPTSAQADQVRCMGINSCKGTGACKTASNACKGQNGCKGQGFVMAESAKACTDKGGKVLKG